MAPPTQVRQNKKTRKNIEKAAQAMQKGQFTAAAEILETTCKPGSKNTEALLMLAAAYGQQGKTVKAEDTCRRVLAYQPENTRANSILGNTLALQGLNKAAQECYRLALKTTPGDIGILNNLGNSLYLAGELEEAASILQQVVTLRPDYAYAHNNLGNIYKALNQNDFAIKHFRHAVQLNPGLVETWLNLGSIYSDRIGFPAAAEDCFRKALELQPDNIEAEGGLSNTLRFQGRLDESLQVIQTVLRKHPDYINALAGEADIYERQGQFELAFERIQSLLAKDKSNPMAIDVLIRLCRRFDCCDEAITLGEQLLRKGTLLDFGRQIIHFSLGKLHDKLGNYDQAFEHYRNGNDVINPPFDREHTRQSFSQIAKVFSRDNLKQLPKTSRGDQRPVFILGMPRSGTSLTEQILASHPEVYGAGELNDMNDIAAGITSMTGNKQQYPECVLDLNQNTVDLLAQRYLTRLDGFSLEARRITDKMPHNFMNIGLIELLFPQARIIHCVRDPRDTCLSIYFQNFGWLHRYASNLENLGFYYREYRNLMLHWEAAVDLPVKTVRYEDMVSDQERVSRELVDFCGLEWDDRCLQFHNSGRTVPTASYDQVRESIYSSSVNRWRHYQQYVGPLVKSLGDTLDPS